ncbi:PTS lactose/cellobiose transporter subunit IIA [Tessaracoccus caeni]|uniref:PTS lactose/cellobiose transporter subunit IIA n=1 Tax=Tessaracoccus caeni TaxID=3031239 RepID=UPI0023DA2A61|nr:PTS lactose/cellobiose transporter subunit IIA [Tessaracoccus caeni]MDF1487549.1 PTS lactose/cellobiose transporter subunit IIA [Tessaracoccus caeni]
MEAKQIAASAMQIIIKSGEGRSNTYRAIDAVHAGDFAKAAELIKEANQGIKAAHIVHTEMIQSEAGGEEFGYSMLFSHAQDTLMTAYSEFRLVKKLLPTLESFDARLRALEATDE